jgi:hypothetical protein
MASLYLGFAILLIAIVLFFISGRQRRLAGLPREASPWGTAALPQPGT